MPSAGKRVMGTRSPPSMAPVIAIVTAIDEYQRKLLRPAQRVLAEHGIPLIAHADGPFTRGASSPLLTSLLETHPPAGILCVNALNVDDHDRLLALLDRSGLPTVFIGLDVPGTACVQGENVAGMRALLHHVLDERGVRRPVLVRGKEHHPDSIARERVLRHELAVRGLELDEALVLNGDFAPEPTADALFELLARRTDFDAVIALNDQMAVSAISTLLASGLRVPEDVVVTGFDDDDAAANWPGLTTVDQDLEQQGATAAALLLERIAGSRETRKVVVPSRLVVRHSTASTPSSGFIQSRQLAEMARTERYQLASQDAVLAMSQALDYCWTVDDVVRVLGNHLSRLGVARGFLALYERLVDGSSGAADETIPARVQLVLDHRDGTTRPPPTDLFAAEALLPPGLRGELDHGLLVLQPLAVLDRPIGFLLFEQRGGALRLPELMRIDLSRALDGVFTTQELRARAIRLEREVDRRTLELRGEVLVRRRTERKLERANQELQRSVMSDGLTRIANRVGFEQHLQQHWAAQVTDGRAVALLMADVDAFKPYNDHYGHVLGDEALRVVASCLARAVRDSDDLACRYGGEEFAVVLPHSGAEGADAVAQRFRALLAEEAIPHLASPYGETLTASIGVAVMVPRDMCRPEELIEAADQAMYRAKALGRDRIEFASRRAVA